MLTVSTAIKAGDQSANVDPKSKGMIPVVIRTSEAFDAATVDVATVRFGATGTEAAPGRAVLEDVDQDGDMDMVLLFRTQETGIRHGISSASLTGKTSDGREFRGAVRTGEVQ